MINNRLYPRFIWTLCALAVVFTFVGLGLELAQSSSAPSPADVANTLTLQLFMIVSAVVGSLIVTRQPRNTVGWLLLFIPVATSLLGLIDQLGRTALAANPQHTTLALLISWLSGWSWWLLIGPILLIPLLFPNGKPPSPRWRVVEAAIALCFAFFMVAATFSPVMIDEETGRQLANPLGLFSLAAIDLFFNLFQIMLLSVSVASLASIFVRFRRSSGVEREQIKWFFYACTVFIGIYASNFLRDLNENAWAGVVFNIALTGIPLAIGAAILRYHLWDIDFLIRRTLTYTLLTGLMALLYFGGVTLLQRLFTLLSGQQSALATIISTLLIAGLFNPLRHRIQNAIDRRYNRKKYDMQKVVDDFVGSTRNQTDLTTLSDELIHITQQALEPENINLWIRNRG